MHIQQLAVIVAFNEELLDKAIGFLAVIPVVGKKFQQPLKNYLVEQKRKLHEKTSSVSTGLHLMYTQFIKIRIFLDILMYFNISFI